jgi:hypothetical protein
MAKAKKLDNKARLKRNYDTGKSLLNLGNIAVASLLFGQAFSGFPFNFELAILGLLLLAWFYVTGRILMKGGDGS